MDKKITNNLIVGLVVLVGFIGFVFVLFNVGGGGMLDSQYHLYGKFKHVKGLHLGSEVTLSGLRIGTVTGLEIPKENGGKELIAEFSISKKYQDRLREDSVAVIKTQGVLGDKYIEIEIGTLEKPELKNKDFIVTLEPPDLISQSGSMFSGISKQFEKEGDLTNLLKNLNVVSQNLAYLTTEMKKDKGLLHEILKGTSGEKINHASGHIESILKKIDSGEGTLGALVNDPTVYEDLRSLMGGAKRSSLLQYFVRGYIKSGKESDKKTK